MFQRYSSIVAKEPLKDEKAAGKIEKVGLDNDALQAG
jgi:hypothetical protein